MKIKGLAIALLLSTAVPMAAASYAQDNQTSQQSQSGSIQQAIQQYLYLNSYSMMHRYFQNPYLAKVVKENRQSIINGLNDAIDGKAPKYKLSQQQSAKIQKEFEKAEEKYFTELTEENIIKGRTYFDNAAKDKNYKKIKVSSENSAYLIKTITPGTGASPTAADTVTVNYTGKFIDGKTFDKGEGISFPLKEVIKGWTESLQQMKVGGEYQVVIPAPLAYGNTAKGPIPPGSTLVFDIKLLSIKGSK